MTCPVAVFVNGAPRPVPPGQTAAGLLVALGLARPDIMVAVNGAAIPAGERDGHILRAGDHVEIIQATAGG